MCRSGEVRLDWSGKDKVLLGFHDDGRPIWVDSLKDIGTKDFVRAFSYGACDSINGISPQGDSFFIKGDNLYSLKGLQHTFHNSIKCIYIDPPFNTGKTFDHYADALENRLWLSMMKVRLELMHSLLSEDGVILVHIDDNEMPYLKVLMDEIFGGYGKAGTAKNGARSHVATIVWQKKFAPQNDARFFSDDHDFILVYAKDISRLRINPVERTKKQNSRYKNRDNDPRGAWTSGDLTVKTPNPEWVYPIKLPSGRIVQPAKSRSWGFSRERFQQLVDDNRIWFGVTGNAMPRLKRFLSEVRCGVVPRTIWLRDEVGDNSEGKKEVKQFIKHENRVFTTPKPERLLQRLIHIATDEGDWVLDAFLGSGTTCAVAQKMNRKWIGLESGDQLDEICVPRLKSVVDGSDKGGVTKKVGWQGGGGFAYYGMR